MVAVCVLAGVLACLSLAPEVSAQASFRGPTDFPFGGKNPSAVALGDFNADSDPDLAVANVTPPDGRVSVLLGGAGGSFDLASSFAVGYVARSVAVGDFNADSDPDLAVATDETNDTGTVQVLLGGAGGSFGAPTGFAVGGRPEQIAVGDFNADSDPDLAVVVPDADRVQVLLGGAGGSFGAPTNFGVGRFPRSVAVGDFNADSDPDLAVTNNSGSGSVSVLLGGAGGSFVAAANLALDGFPSSVAVGDFNADSDPDLAVTSNTAASGGVSVLLGGAGGSFSSPTRFGARGGVLSVAVGDFNADSDPDLVFANGAPDVVPPANVQVRLGGVGASFGDPTTFGLANYARSIAVGDFNGDRDPDLALPIDESLFANFGNVSVLLNSRNPPPLATLADSDPDSPANDNSPRVRGAAAAGVTVRLYASADCSGAPAATGSAASFASPGLAVSVPDDSLTVFRAISTRADITSECSSSSLTYVEDTQPPAAGLALSRSLVLTGDTVSFDASASSDQPGGTIARYQWDLDGDGTFETDTGASPTASRAFSAPAEIAPGVRVTSSLGQSAVARKPLTIRSRPPAGRRVGITLNGGAPFTNDPDVTINAGWPPFAAGMVIANDGGFTSPLVLPVAEAVPWQLSSSGSERLPKIVYVRFEGAEPARETYGFNTYTDDIILDQTSPRIQAVTFTGSGARAAATASRSRRYRIRLRASDNVTGIVGYQATAKRRRPGNLRRFSKRRVTVRRTIRVRARSARLYVRVRDAAGNNSKWRRVKRRSARR